nr:MAG TPA: hypothetical protein [Caudoviricetes sp.]
MTSRGRIRAAQTQRSVSTLDTSPPGTPALNFNSRVIL